MNMIISKRCVRQSSNTINTDLDRKLESTKGRLRPGTYREEASRIGYETDTQTVEIKEHTRKKIEFKLRQIQEGTRKTIQGSKSDEDKIINPGEVNIQAPTL